MKQINNSAIEKQIKKDPKFKRELARRSHYWFFHIYLPHYVKYKTAIFQKVMINLCSNPKIKVAVVTAFRGSAKSTIMSLSYPLWAMITGDKKFIIILSQNQKQSETLFSNIKRELEENTQLISDFGPFRQIFDEWNKCTLIVNSYGCKISCISSGESIRGIRHKENRPDLIIVDDVEDLASVKTKEGRDRTFNWLTGEVIPAGDSNTKIMIVGNKLHEDGLMMRLKKAIQDGNFAAIYSEYPFLDESGSALWIDKFPTLEDIDNLKRSIGSEAAWQREYLLKIVPQDDAVVLAEWIKYYNQINEYSEDFRYTAAAIDLAISESESADYTAIVAAKVYHYGQDVKIYILPNPINKRLNFPQTVEQVKMLYIGCPIRLFIEDVGYQRSLIQELRRQGYHAEGVKPMGQDKRARLTFTTHLIENGNVLFPLKGCEDLIGQLTGFGYEKHDDLADAFAMLIIKILEHNGKPPVVTGCIV